MKILKALPTLVLFSAVCFSQDATIIARMGMRNAATYHYFEAFHTHRGKWIYPDVGYIDFGKNGYWEFFLGGGAILFSNEHLTVIHCNYIDRARGPKSLSATYYLPWGFVGYKINRKIASETVYFPYLPLNKPARIQHVLERAKLEYDFKYFRLGGGSSCYQYGEGSWQHKPFATWTLKAGSLGELELWLQRIPRNSILGNNARGNFVQAQIRLAKTFKKD